MTLHQHEKESIHPALAAPGIEFPLYDVSDYGWNEFREKEHNIIFQNPYAGIVPYLKKKFVNRMKQYEFMDCSGKVYKVNDIEFTKPQGVRGFFTLASLITLKFYATGRTITLEEFRNLVITRAAETGNAPLEETAKRAGSISEILKPV